MSRIRRLLPFSPVTTPLQATTYLLGISLFSISFLVFLNSAVSFLITDLIDIKTRVGDIVGTLGFVDEIVALVACPVWGLVSDRLGVRWVAVLGYTVIGISLACFVQVGQGWEGVRGLIGVRILFAIGATATATMVTAILPSLTDDGSEDGEDGPRSRSRKPAGHSQRSSVAMSYESDMTITPERFSRGLSADGSSRRSDDGEQERVRQDEKGRKPSALAGFVGLFTGCGALVALSLFLPLPAEFSKREGVTPAQAITYSFYVVAAVALCVAVFVFFGLRGLRGEDGKGWRMLLGSKTKQTDSSADDTSLPDQSKAYKPLAYRHLLVSSLRLGLTDRHIAVGYLGGFVARASSVAISLFIPLYINTFFISNGFCQGSPHDPTPELKKECRTAYILSSILSGAAQLIALLCAPLFGYLSAKRWRGVNLPILISTVCGVVGYIAFPQLQSPEYKDVDGRGGSGVVFLVVALLGISQIGAIVCSLGSLGRGVLSADLPTSSTATTEQNETDSEAAPLLEDGNTHPAGEGEKLVSRVQLKGSVAGVYSWCGGAAILLLTKLGGYLFDVASTGAPFYMMASFNAILLVAVVAIDLGRGIGAARFER
ncbi:putative Major facilitator superfamily transporter [Seiridium cardinale]|uniref:Major facilitator superfamily transporter n=1 Tax=Seiridium cardinale TaxID=138064 RepID=A0ABR2Y0A4_9PEZI